MSSGYPAQGWLQHAATPYPSIAYRGDHCVQAPLCSLRARQLPDCWRDQGLREYEQSSSTRMGVQIGCEVLEDCAAWTAAAGGSPADSCSSWCEHSSSRKGEHADEEGSSSGPACSSWVCRVGTRRVPERLVGREYVRSDGSCWCHEYMPSTDGDFARRSSAAGQTQYRFSAPRPIGPVVAASSRRRFSFLYSIPVLQVPIGLVVRVGGLWWSWVSGVLVPI